MRPPRCRGGRWVQVRFRGGRSFSHRLAVLHELLTDIPGPVAYVAGPGLIFEYANDAYRQLVGREDLIGRPVREALPELAAQGRAELVTAVLVRAAVPGL